MKKKRIFNTIVLLILFYGPMAWAQIAPPVQLNDPLVMYGDVDEFQINSAGNTVVYLASQESVSVRELFRVPVGGGSKTKLNPMLVSGGDVRPGFKISPNGALVVYIADQDLNGVNELYSVPIGGGASVKLNSNLVDGQDVFEFKISADSSTVVYRADQDTIDDAELYSVPIGGGASTKLNDALVLGADVLEFKISSDSTRVIYIADQTINHSNELFTTLISGGGSTKLNPAFSATTQDVAQFELSPDSTRVVYMADVTIDHRDELFSVPIAGGAAVKLNGALREDGEVLSFSISADSSWVVYRAFQEFNAALYSIPTSGGTENELSPTILGGVRDDDFKISPNSDVVAFRWRGSLYSVSILGGTLPVNLSPNMSVVPGSVTPQFLFTANGTSIVFIAAENSSRTLFQLYVVDFVGSSAPVRLSEKLRPSLDVSSFRVSDDGARVIYLADQIVDGRIELFTVDLASRVNERVNRDLPSRSFISRFEFSPDNRHIVYLSDQDVRLELELFSVDYTPVSVADPDAFPCFPIVVESGGIVEVCL